MTAHLRKDKMAEGLRKGLTSYGDAGFSLFLRKAFIKAMGYSDDALNRPIVGITNTFSDYNPCHGNVPQIIEAVKRGDPGGADGGRASQGRSAGRLHRLPPVVG
jgi:dihydroxyacid dehydratase/phosphogluconate dehydratase